MSTPPSKEVKETRGWGRTLCLGIVAAAAILLTAILIVGIVYGSNILHKLNHSAKCDPHITVCENSELCSDSENSCVQGRLCSPCEHPEDGEFCESRNKPNGVACEDDCMFEETGVCSDGRCKGVCAGQCNFMDEGFCFSIGIVLSNVIVLEMAEEDGDDYDAFATCQFGSCVHYFGPLQELTDQVPFIFDADFRFNIRDEKFMQDLCFGFLNQTESNIHCLTAGIFKEYDDGNHYNIDAIGDGPDGEIFPEVDDAQFWCTYRYTCAPLELQFDPFLPLEKRSDPIVGSDQGSAPTLSNGHFNGHRPSRRPRPTIVPK
jgi:hypothetical protein